MTKGNNKVITKAMLIQYMPKKIPQEDKRQIVRLRALDYTKQEIAEKVGVSRNTVRRHLNEVREQVEDSDQPENLELARYMFEPDELISHFTDRSADLLNNLGQNFVAVPAEQLMGLKDQDDQ